MFKKKENTNHSVDLVTQALLHAISQKQMPRIIHSDQGSEYASRDYTNLIQSLDIQLSMSHKSSPWENGYQESFYSQFKLELGDPNRFKCLGQLSTAVCQQIYYYNHLRIHSSLKMPPSAYAKIFQRKKVKP